MLTHKRPEHYRWYLLQAISLAMIPVLNRYCLRVFNSGSDAVGYNTLRGAETYTFPDQSARPSIKPAAHWLVVRNSDIGFGWVSCSPVGVTVIIFTLYHNTFCSENVYNNVVDKTRWVFYTNVSCRSTYWEKTYTKGIIIVLYYTPNCSLIFATTIVQLCFEFRSQYNARTACYIQIDVHYYVLTTK